MLLERLRQRLIAGVVGVDPFLQEQLVNRGADHHAGVASFGLGVVAEPHSHEGSKANHVVLSQWPAVVALVVMEDRGIQAFSGLLVKQSCRRLSGLLNKLFPLITLWQGVAWIGKLWQNE